MDQGFYLLSLYSVFSCFTFFPLLSVSPPQSSSFSSFIRLLLHFSHSGAFSTQCVLFFWTFKLVYACLHFSTQYFHCYSYNLREICIANVFNIHYTVFTMANFSKCDSVYPLYSSAERTSWIHFYWKKNVALRNEWNRKISQESLGAICVALFQWWVA